MAVNYSVVKQKYNMSGNGSLKFYAHAQASGKVKFKKLCAKISDRCTVTKGDVMVVLESCITVMKDYLEEGLIIQLGDFGNFQVSLSSTGADTEADFSNSNINAARIVFRPGVDLKEMFDDLEYNKVSVNTAASNASTDETEETSSTGTETTGV
jgi:predicted histone-like DNA-binding protein